MASYSIVHDLVSGIENAPSGTAFFYLPNTLTPTIIYGDDTGTPISNPVTLDSNGRGTVYLSRLTRMIVQTVGAVTVLDTVINASSDTTVANSSTAFTGTNQKDINDSAQAAFGGQDYRYVPSVGASGMLPKAWMNGVLRNVKAYGAKGDGVTLDDIALAAAIADAKAAGGGVLFFEKGTYLISASLSLSSVNGVSFVGVGVGASVIKASLNNINALSISSCNGFVISGLEFEGPITNTGTAISLTSCGLVTIRDVGIGYSSGTWNKGITISAVSSDITIASTVIGSTTAAGARGIVVTDSERVTVLGGFIASTGQTMELAGATGEVSVFGTHFDNTGVLFNASVTGTGFTFIGSPSLGATSTPFTISTATDPGLRQEGNAVDGYTVNVAIGGNHTPNRALGSEIRIKANSGGAGTVTVNAPTPPPTATMRDVKLTIKFVNASGGAVTWAFAAATFVFVGAAVPANTDLHTITMLLLWDPDTSRWRELTRGDTLT